MNETLKNEDRREVEFIGNPKRDLLIAKNIRESEIEYLSAKRVINHFELEVANIYRKIYEATVLKATGDNMSMVKYGCRIDGGGTNSDAIDNRLKAINKLNYIHRVIGQNYADLMHHIVGQGFTIKQYSMLSKTKPRKVSRLLREALHFTAEPLGMTKTRHTIRA